jgi:hypothetical protein
MLAAGAGHPAAAGSLADPTDCFIDNPNPTVIVGVQASYVVQLLGGNGSYSVTMSYGDGGNPDSQSTNTTTATFAHYFASSGVVTQTATVASAGSSARCTATTTVQ